MYILLRRIVVPGYKSPYYTVFESEDRNVIVEKLKQHVLDGCRISDLKIVKEEKFEFKCGVKFEEE